MPRICLGSIGASRRATSAVCSVTVEVTEDVAFDRAHATALLASVARPSGAVEITNDLHVDPISFQIDPPGKLYASSESRFMVMLAPAAVGT